MKIKKLSLTLALGLTLTLGLLVSFTLAAPGNPDPEPDPNTHTAPPDTTVALSYDEAMDAATVTSHTFAVHAFQTGLLTATHGVQGHTILVTPTRPFHPGELVQTTATTRTLSITGEQPLSYTVWGFRADVGGGTGVFAPHPITSSFGGGRSMDIALGDIDGDGDLDAVVANDFDEAQDVYLNNGRGGFTFHSNFGSGLSYAVALGDIDGDGDLDAVVANRDQGQYVYLNDGSGNFVLHFDYPIFSDNGWDIALGDVDGDGDLDAVVALTWEVYLNEGSGGFIFHSNFNTGVGYAVALGDVDGDGDLDAVLAKDIPAANEVCLNNGDGRFTQCSTLGSDTDSSYDVALGDLDGDGDLDAVVANDGAAQDVYLNDGDGTFVGHSTFGGGSSTSIALGDIDGDGDLDAVVANHYDQSQLVYLNDGSGTFAQHPTSPPLGAGNSQGVALGDIDGDGDLDALVANWDAAQTVWSNRARVEEVTPAPNSHDAPLDASLAVTTSTPMSPSGSPLFVHGGSQGYMNGTLSFDTPVEATSIHFDPDDDWFPGELVQTTVSTDVLDSHGLPIVAPYVWQFRTATQGGSGALAPHPNAPTFGAVDGNSLAVALGDLDGDGDLDAVVADMGPNMYSFRNDGSGALTPHPGVPTFGNGGYDVTLGDVDGDGDLDAVAARVMSSYKDVYFNNGSGAFVSSSSFRGQDEQSIAVTLGDVDGDGDLDVVTTGSSLSGAPQEVHFNDGSGGFTEYSTFGTNNSWDIALGDVDGDGDLDAVVANYGAAQDVFLNDGNGAFASHLISPTFGASDSKSSGVALGDVDGDGDLDAVIANDFSAAQDVYLNDGSGAFAEHSTSPHFGASNSASCDVALGDVDGDGDLDAITANENGAAEGVYLNDGSGAFTAHPNSPTFGAGDSRAVAVGDMDGDGDLDAVVANDGQADTVWLNRPQVIDVAPTPNSHDISLEASLSVTASHPIIVASVTTRTLFVHGGSQGHVSGTLDLAPVEPTSILFAPDDDWFPGELVQTSVTTGVLDANSVPLVPYVWQFRAATQGGSGAFALHPISPTFGGGDSYDVALGDLDSDGDLDAIIANSIAPQSAYLNDGGGAFAPHPTPSAIGAGTSFAVALGDVDGDGDLDAVVANIGAAHAVCLNNGSGAFPVTHTFGVSATTSTDIALGDVDGDGDLDAVVANAETEAQEVYLNDGSGTFTGHPISPTFGAGYSQAVALGDVDGDGDLDAILASYRGDPQEVYLNDGRGAFTPASTFGDGNSRDVALGDVDGDGDLDAITANDFGAAEDVYLNDGDGVFTHVSSFGAGSDSWDIALGDVDGDGDLDALVANSNGQAQDVYLNDGNGAFAPHPTSPAFGSSESYAVALGDLDGDGDLDAVVANANDEAQTVWLNQSRADLFIAKTVVAPAGSEQAGIAVPGDPITYTLTFANNGPETVTRVAINDSVPVSVVVSGEWAVGSGEITRTAGVTFEWTVSRLEPGEGGVITITGWLSDALPHGYAFANTATITAAVLDTDTLNNEDAASITVDAQSPDAPVLLSPADGALINDATPTLIWQASAAPDIAGYLLDLNGSVSDVGDVTQSTTFLLADGAYTWTVAAYDEVDNTSPYTDTWSFTVDTVSPQLMSFSPPDEAQEVAIDTALVLTFSEAINASTFTYSVSPDPGGWSATWGGETTVLPGGSVVTLTHDNPFGYMATYTVAVSAAEDPAGNPLSGAPHEWSFATLPIPLYLPLTFFNYDGTPPTVWVVGPPDGAQDVALDAALVITFSEVVSPSTFVYGIAPDPGGWSATWGETGPSLKTVVTLTHDSPFAYQTIYTVTVSAVEDLVGNSLATPFQWSFTSLPAPDVTPPTVKAVSPPNAAQDVAINAALVITFSEVVSASTFAHSVTPDPGGWLATWGGEIGALPGGSVVTLTHDLFAYLTTYTITINAAADEAGNPMIAATQWSFTTVTTDTISPTVTAVSPPAGAQDVALDAALVITFSETISAASLAYGVSPDPGGWSAAWSDGDTVVTLSHDVFTSSITYTAVLTAADDLGGNPLSGAPYAWSFATSSGRRLHPSAVHKRR